jgi:hypothetical protein
MAERDLKRQRGKRVGEWESGRMGEWKMEKDDEGRKEG